MNNSLLLGAIAGDIIGARFEFKLFKDKSKDFDLFIDKPVCTWTDDTVMTLATAKALVGEYFPQEFNYDSMFKAFERNYQELGRRYEDAGYGANFREWIFSTNPMPYGSFGNGSAMRVSPCGIIAKSLEDAEQLAAISASVTHNHPEGIKGAVSTAGAVYLAKAGASKKEIKNYIKNFYDMDFSIDEIRPEYKFYASCQNSVPQAIQCFLEATDFEDCIRNAISLGGDTDTQAAIAGSIAGAFYGIPNFIADAVMQRLNPYQKDIIKRFDIVNASLGDVSIKSTLYSQKCRL